MMSLDLNELTFAEKVLLYLLGFMNFNFSKYHIFDDMILILLGGFGPLCKPAIVLPSAAYIPINMINVHNLWCT